MNESRLVMNQGPQVGQTFVIAGDREMLTIGRDPSNDFVIGDPQVSRQHARIVRRGDALVLEDTGSTNGTFVNGVRLTGPHTLSNGDVVGLGDSVVLTFYGSGPAVTVPLGGAATAVGAPPSPPPPPPSGPAYAPPPAYGPSQPPPPPPAFAAEEQPQSKKGLWIGCGCLALLVLCVGVGLFLWFAPTSFWQTLINLGIPVPSWPF